MAPKITAQELGEGIARLETGIKQNTEIMVEIRKLLNEHFVSSVNRQPRTTARRPKKFKFNGPTHRPKKPSSNIYIYFTSTNNRRATALKRMSDKFPMVNERYDDSNAVCAETNGKIKCHWNYRDSDSHTEYKNLMTTRGNKKVKKKWTHNNELASMWKAMTETQKAVLKRRMEADQDKYERDYTKWEQDYPLEVLEIQKAEEDFNRENDVATVAVAKRRKRTSKPAVTTAEPRNYTGDIDGEHVAELDDDSELDF